MGKTTVYQMTDYSKLTKFLKTTNKAKLPQSLLWRTKINMGCQKSKSVPVTIQVSDEQGDLISKTSGLVRPERIPKLHRSQVGFRNTRLRKFICKKPWQTAWKHASVAHDMKIASLLLNPSRA